MSGHVSDIAPPEVSVRETELVPVMRRLLLAPGSPGVVGYVVAVAVTLVTLALEMALAAVFSSDGRGNVMLGFVGFVLLVVLVGAIPAAIIGAVGVFAVHVITLGARAQVWHVLAAGVVGYGMAWALLLSDWPTPLWWIAPLATMIGRAAVIPMALKRRAAMDAASPAGA